MIRIRVTKRPGACVNYFLRDASLTERERQGVWVGSTCHALGVTPGASVAPHALALVLDGYTADGVNFLQRPNVALQRRSAYDVVVSASKSVSMAALCWQEWGANVRRCFGEAAHELVGVMERLARRQGRRSDRWRTGRLAAAVFVHDSSRYGDPHLHAHLLVPNVTDSAGRFWALAADGIYGVSKVLDGVFQRALAGRLRAAGFCAELRNGVAVVPVDEALCRKFSRGHNAIEAVADRLAVRHGITGRRRKALEQVVNDRIRPRKRGRAPGAGFVGLVDGSAFARVRGVVTPRHEELSSAEMGSWVRRELLQGGFGGERAQWEVALRAAWRRPSVPFEACLEAAMQPPLVGVGEGSCELRRARRVAGDRGRIVAVSAVQAVSAGVRL